MSAFKGKLNIKSILLYTVCAVFCIAACVALFCLNVTHAVALEQEIRCGIEEHTHTDRCYDGDFLICKTPAHTHDGNCYLVLLKENDINGILTLLGNSDTHSLENVINDTVSSALTFNANINTPESPGQAVTLPLNQNTVEKLNNTISDEETLPDIVLNENINSVETLSGQDAVSGTVSKLEIGGTPITSNKNANFYVRLDGAWTYIGTCTFIVQEQSSWWNTTYYNRADTPDIVRMINAALGTTFTHTSFSLSVSTRLNNSYSTDNVDIASSTTTLYASTNSGNANAAKYVRLIPAGSNSANDTGLSFYTVNFVYPDGGIVSRIVRSGTSISMPSGNYEWEAGNKTYNAGDSVTITGKTTFTGTSIGPVTYINLSYNVNFPTVSNVTFSTKPTLAGLTVTTVADGFTQGSSAVIRNVSQHSVEGKVNNNSTGLSRVVQFKGWKVGNSDVILQPNTTLVWEELLQYATGSELTLTALWDYHALQTASFFVRFDSVAVDTDGNITGQDQNKYTNELFSAYVGGVDPSLGTSRLHELYHVADVKPDNSFAADQEIRALYGERTEGAYLSAFPSDEYIFESLVQYAKTGYLSVDGVAVKAEDLNNREYAIRWYVFKAQDDAWHIDGKLVRKEGLIHVYKTFAGNKELIAEAKTDFYIDATDITAGTNTVLDLNNYTTYNSATDTYMWEIANVDYGELWEITEHPHLFADPGVDFGVYSEYTVMDAHGDQSITGSGTSLTVSGMTYALDEGTDEVLRAEFTNIYSKTNSIVIKKQDALTGVSISGATFRLLQNGVPLKFNYNSSTECYEYDAENGTQTVLSGTANGYFEIAIEDFSYDLGNIVVQEVSAPTGYSPIGNIEIGYVDDRNTIGIISGNSEMIKYFNGILIVGNSTDVMSVTAQKQWDCPENEWQPVTVQLLANGKLVTTVIAGVESQVVLSSDNNWQYTWNNLPIYVNGERIEWSIRETAIGSESAKADGSFVNWLASYGIPIQSTDEKGDPHTILTVINTTKRVMLRLTKTNLSKTSLLKGAQFLLEGVDADGNVLSSEIAKTGTTGENGTLIFDNLKCGIRYRLTEQISPTGYLPMNEYIYFLINEDGSVSVEESYFAEAGNTAYNLIVRNVESIELPDSGGRGISLYYALGLTLCVAAAGIYISHLCKRRCQH